MKNLIFAISVLLVSFSASSASATQSNVQDYACYVTQENQTPTDRKDFRFWVHIDPAGESSLTYQRLTDNGYGRSFGIYGCDNAKLERLDSEQITLNCANDGEEGSVVISLPSGKGEIYFWVEKLRYDPQTLLQVQCVKQ